MFYRHALGAVIGCLIATPLAAQLPEPSPDRINAWWGHVEELASDANEGRGAGTPGYDRAADYVVASFRKLGAQAGGTDGYFQRVDLVEQRFDQPASTAVLKRASGDVVLATPQDLFFRGNTPMPASIDAPLVFAGYGLSIAEAGHDDFAGIDVKGKVVVVLSGGPADISGALKSDARSARAKLLAERGALGMIALTTPKQVEIRWERQVGNASLSSMYLADPALRDVSVPFMMATLSPEKAGLLFEGTGQSFEALSALSDASASLPLFDLPGRFAATIKATQKPLSSNNIIAVLPGSDPALASEYVVLSAHLDGYGIGTPVNGDAIYNGAFDNAVGVASIIEAARALAAAPQKTRRSILFAIITAEEKGLLGSRYFANRPTVPAGSIVANINLDMPLPIFPLTSITPIGYEESTLGAHAQAVSEAMGLPIVPDPKPDRNVFIRSDQYSFIKQGIPALFPKYGFKLGTPEEAVEAAWRANIYHSPQDDLLQPVMKAEGVKLTDYVIALTQRVANAPERPRWLHSSYFKRFAN
ncbi:Zn-dependent M28 family amino/carboxypeptidase [Sphingobium sp. B11D3B]|uniref:M28 family metallopeptidase n=1 Tax=Sphingobium sp. B11D3B TaxID=2940575 RepID=UPI00222601B2|nr:M28 family metallopeptidase [Sphingobium sp. B11D3B]MCW2388926.1 Zn-dependent M28 family amino/carboxypeptidase [Sphingobium sp. B11D3B]